MRSIGRLPGVLLCAASSCAGIVPRAVADSPADTAPARVWAGACTYCHDEGVAPRVFGVGLTPAVIAAVVRGGLNGMPAFHPSELTDAEVKVLADWVARQPVAAGKR